MIIQELRLRNFGRMQEVSLSLAPGFNVIWGPNEAGKSTLLASLFLLLFEKPNTTKTAVARWRRWGASQMYELAMTFEAEGSQYELVKNFEDQTSVLHDLTAEQTWHDPNEVQRQLSRLVGTGSPTIYQSTAGLRQQEIVGIQEGRRLGELLQETVSGAADDVSVEQVIGRLQSVLSELQRGTKGAPTRNLGEIAAAQQQLSELGQREQEIAVVINRAEAARQSLGTHQGELEQLTAELHDLERLLKQAEERRELQQRRENLQEQAMELQRRADRVCALKDDIKEAQQELATLPGVTVDQAREAWRVEQTYEQAGEQEREAGRLLEQLEVQRQKVEAKVQQAEGTAPGQELLTRAIAFQEDIARLGSQLEELRDDHLEAEQRVRVQKERSNLRSAALIMGVLFLLVGGVAGMMSHPGFFAVSGLGTVMLLWGAFLRVEKRTADLHIAVEEARRAVKKAETDHSRARQQLLATLDQAGVNSVPALSEQVGEGSEESVALGRELSQVEARLETMRQQQQIAREKATELQARRQQLLADQFGSTGEMQEIAQRRDQLHRQIESRQGELEGTLLESEEDLENRLRELAVERGTLDQRLESSELAAAQMSPTDLAHLRGDLERKRSRREEILREQTEAQTLLRSAAYDVEDLYNVQEQKAETERRLHRRQRRERVMTITLETLCEARQETLHAATDILEPTIEELLQRLTRGRYAQVSVSRETLEPIAFSPEKGAPADQQHDLSLATREQLYLASRLALTKLLWPDEGPPLLLDDPLVNFDEDRGQEACRLLAEFARQRQVLLFTCSDYCSDTADKAIDLTQIEPPAGG